MSECTSDRRPVRKRLFVDKKVQGALLVRSTMYWVMSLMTIALMILCWRILTGPPRVFYAHLDSLWLDLGPALAVSLVLLPVVLVDVVKLSNRFVGPQVRLRRSLARLAAGEQVEPLSFRDGDFWQEIAVEFNAVRARLQPEQNDESPDEDREIRIMAG
jgi:hypothetical protein